LKGDGIFISGEYFNRGTKNRTNGDPRGEDLEGTRSMS
jgi:hypothetical protein